MFSTPHSILLGALSFVLYPSLCIKRGHSLPLTLYYWGQSLVLSTPQSVLLGDTLFCSLPLTLYYCGTLSAQVKADERGWRSSHSYAAVSTTPGQILQQVFAEVFLGILL